MDAEGLIGGVDEPDEVQTFMSPYKNVEMRKRLRRNAHRRVRHGLNWRSVIHQYGGLCGVCGEPVVDDFHEPFGEDKRRTGKLQARIPMCFGCHHSEHDGCLVRRKETSSYLSDVGKEVEECGSYDSWLERYDVGAPDSVLCYG